MNPPEVDLKAAREARDEGLESVSGHDPRWFDLALAEAHRGLSFSTEFFIGEDIRLYLLKFVGEPPHPNAWGALINELQKLRLIVPTGTHRQMRVKTSHARESPEYRFPSSLVLVPKEEVDPKVGLLVEAFLDAKDLDELGKILLKYLEEWDG